MTILLALVALFPLGDSNLLRYRLPDVTASAFDLGVNENTSLGTPHYGKDLRLGLSPSYQYLVLGERMNLTVNAGLNASAEPLYVYPAAVPDTDWSETGYRVNPGASASLDWYPLRFPLGLGGDLSAYYDASRYHSTWLNGSARLEGIGRGSTALASFDLGPSLGRFRDARTVIQALRIVEILAQEQQALRPANDDDVQMLADLLAAKPSYSLHFHQPGKNWFADLETLLRNRGLARPHMPARTWFLIREAIETATSLARPVGWRLSVRPGLLLSKWSDKDSSADWNRAESVAQRTPRLTLQLETGYPLNRRLQFAQTASWFMSVDTSPEHSHVEASVAMEYHVFDQLLASVGYSVLYTDYGYYCYSDVGELRWRFLQHGPALSITYYREDRLRANASMGLEWCRYHAAAPPAALVRQTSFNWSLGISYRLMP